MLLGRVDSIEEFENTNIRMTELTCKLAKIIVDDGNFLHTKECEKYNEKKKSKSQQMIPYMTNKSVDSVFSRIKCYSFDKRVEVAEFVYVTFIPNGHISGSASILLEIYDNENEKQTLLFSGDTSGTEKSIPFTKKLDVKGLCVNHVLMESTYNDRLIPKNNIEEVMPKYIKETCIDKKGSLCLPCFSIGRSSNALLYLKRIYEKHSEFNNIKIYMCSPMMNKSHDVLCNDDSFEFYDEKWIQEIKELKMWDKVEYVSKFTKVKEILGLNKPCIFIASSGMIQAYSDYIVGRLIGSKKNRIVMMGYSAEGTKARLLKDKVQKTMQVKNEEGKKTSVVIRAEVSECDGQSGHLDFKDACELLCSLEKKKLKTVLLNHGNPSGMEFFKEKIEGYLPNVKVRIPKYNELIRLY